MAVRISNTNELNFGTFGAAANVSHVHARVGTAVLGTRALTSAQNVALGGQFRIPAGDLDFVFPAGTDGIMNAGLNSILSEGFNQNITIEARTDANTEVTVSGYSAQTTNAWSATNEAD